MAPNVTAKFQYNGQWYDSTVAINVPTSDTQYVVSCSATADIPDYQATYTWVSKDQFNNVYAEGSGKTLTYKYLNTNGNDYPKIYCIVSNTSDGTYGESNLIYPNVYFQNEITINSFSVTPNTFNYTSGVSQVAWDVTGASNIYVIHNGATIPFVSPTGIYALNITGNDQIYLSAVSGGRSVVDSKRAIVNYSISDVTVAKDNYIYISDTDVKRIGDNRNVKIYNNMPRMFEYEDMGEVVQWFENYINTLYDGTVGYSLEKSSVTPTPIPVTSANYFDWKKYSYSTAGP